MCVGGHGVKPAGMSGSREGLTAPFTGGLGAVAGLSAGGAVGVGWGRVEAQAGER